MKNNNLGKNKVLNSIVAFAFFFLQSNFIYAQNALPHGAVVVNGQVLINYQGHILDINASNNAIINWNSFNIGPNNTVNFTQPSSSSIVLNRVVGVHPSYIYGDLNANGRVFLIDPNGIFFAGTSQINANALLASTQDISNSDFLAGNYNFYQNGKPGWIINQGNIHVTNGGYVVLLSNAINNSGLIEAKLGRVLLAAGEKMTVALDDDSDITVTIDDAVSNGVFGPDGAKITQAIQNSGTINADGGSILINAKILNGIFDNAVNNSGVIQANNLVNNNGVIELDAVGGNITNTASGSIVAGQTIDLSSDSYDTNAGLLQAPIIDESSYHFTTTGTLAGGSFFADDIDGAGSYGGNINSNITDTTINLDGDVTLLNDGLMFTATGGGFTSNGYSIDSQGSHNYSLTISAAGASTLGPIGQNQALGNLTLESGSGSQTFTMGGAMTLTGGLTIGSHTTLTDTNNGITLGGNWTNSGTFNAGTDTVTFDGTSAESIAGNSSSPFNNIIVNLTAGQTLSDTGSNTLTVNNLTETTGNFKAPATLNINGNLVLTAGTFTASTLINASGNWTNNGATFTPGTGTVTFDKSNGAQSIGGTGSTTFNNLTVDNNSDLTVNSNITVNGTTQLGVFNNGTGTLTFGNSDVDVTTNIFNIGASAGTANGSGALDMTVGGTLNISGINGIMPFSFGTNGANSWKPGAGTIVFDGASQTIWGQDKTDSDNMAFNNLVISGSGNKTFETGISVNGNLSVDPTGTAKVIINGLNVSVGSLTLGGVNEPIGTWSGVGNFGATHTSSYFTSNPGTLTVSGELSSGYSIDGTAYSDQGVTDLSGATIYLVVNGTSDGSTATANNGTYSFSNITLPSGADVLVYVGSGGTGATVTTIATAANIAGLDIYGNSLIVRSESPSTAITNSILASADGAVPTIYSVSGSNLSTNGSNNLIVWAGDTYAPGGNVTTNNLTIQNGATFTAGSSTDISGNWVNNGGTFNPGSNTVTFDGSGAQVIEGTTATQTFNNLTTSNTSELSTGGSTTALDIDGNLTIGSNTGLDGNFILTVDDNAIFDGAVGSNTPLAGLSVGGTTDFAGGSVNTGTGSQTYTGAVTLGAASTTLTGKGIDFKSTVDSDSIAPRSLTINDSGTTTFGGAVGSQNPLNNLNVTAAGISIGGSIDTAGTLTLDVPGVITSDLIKADGLLLEGTGTFDLNNSSNTVGTIAANIDGSLTYTDAGALTVGTVGRVSGINTDNNTVNLTANDDLNVGGINAGTADVYLTSNNGDITETTGSMIGNTAALIAGGNITVPNLEVNTVAAAATNGDVTLTNTMASGLTIGQVGSTSGISGNNINVTETAGSLTVNNNVMANNNGTITLTSKKSDLSINAYVHAPTNNISFNAGGNFYLNPGSDVWSTSGKFDFEIAGAATLNGNAYTSNNIFELNAGGDITENSGTLGALGTGSLDLTSTGGNIVQNFGYFSGTNVDLTAKSITQNGGWIQGWTGAADNVTLNASAGIDQTGGTLTTDNLLLTGGGTDTLTAANNNVGTLAAHTTGAITLNNDGNPLVVGTVGKVAGITSGSLNLTASGITLDNNVTTFGTQEYDGGVTLGGDRTLIGTKVTFDDALDGAYTLWILGNAQYNGIVGGLTPLTNLYTTGAADINTTSISTTNQLEFDGPATLSNGPVDLSGQIVHFDSTLDGNEALTITGNAQFDGVVGGKNSLSSLDVTGTTYIDTTSPFIHTNSITTSGNQTYEGAATIGTNTTLNGKTVTFNSTLNSVLTPIYNSILAILHGSNLIAGYTHYGLGINGNGVFNGVVGSQTPNSSTGSLSSLAVSGTTNINTTSITSTGAQTYDGAVTIGKDTLLTGDGITFDSTVDSSDAPLISDFNTLEISDTGTTTFNNEVGGTYALGSLTIDKTVGGATNINTALITTSGAQTYDNPLTISVNTNLYGDGVTFGSTLDSSDITTPGTSDSNNLYIDDAGTTTFGGIVGGKYALGNLEIQATTHGTTNIGTTSITTNGEQSYGNSVILSADTKLTGDDILFYSTIDSSDNLVGGASDLNTLEINDAQGGNLFGTIGGTFALGSLLVDPSTGGTSWFTGSVTTSGSQTYDTWVVLGADVKFTGNDITFNDSIDSSASSTITIVDGVPASTPFVDDYNTLEINDTGATTFNGAIGATNPLGSLTIDATTNGTTNINTSSITTNGVQTYNNPLTISTSTTLTGDGITLGSTVDSSDIATPGTSDYNSLTISDSGTTTFGGAVGSTYALGSLDVTANAIDINGGSVTTSGIQQYNGAVVLGKNTKLTSTVSNINVGNTSIGSGYVASNYLVFDEYVVTTPIIVTSINSYGTANGNIYVGIYSNDGGAPGTLLVGSNSTAVTAGSTTIPVTSTLLKAGTYWVAFNIDTPDAISTSNAVGNVRYYQSTPYGALPGTAPGGLIASAPNTPDTIYFSGTPVHAITFSSTVDSSDIIKPGTSDFNTLEIDDSGETTFDGAVGATYELGGLTFDSTTTGTTIIDASITTSGDQTYNNAVILGKDVTLNGTSVTFNSTVDSSDPLPSDYNTLTINDSGDVTFNGTVGGLYELGGLDVTAGRINAGSIFTKGDLTLNATEGSIHADVLKSSDYKIDLTAKRNIDVNVVDAGWANAFLKSWTGFISAGFIKANFLLLDAKKGIGGKWWGKSLKTDARTIVANVWGRHGSINVDDVSRRTVTLKDISTHDGKITIASNGSIDAKNVQSHGGNIDLTAKNNIIVGNINAGWGNVDLTALFGYIEGSSWGWSLVTGNEVTLDAKKGIGGRHALKTDARSIVANVWGRHGSINIDNVSKDTVTLKYISTRDGKITIKSNGSIDAKDVQSRGGNIDLTAKNNIIVGNINAGWGNVDLTALFGYIEGSSWGWSLVTGNEVTLDAKKGIGGRHALKTDARSIVANVWGRHGSINIDNVSKDTVTLKYISTRDGKITIASNGSIDAKDVQSRGGDIKLTAKENIIVGNINAGWGNVDLTALFGYIESAWGWSLITGNEVTLDAKKGIGGRHALKTDARNIVANVWGRHGSINIDNVSKDTVTLKYISTRDGKITVTSNGSIDANNVQSRGGDIKLTAKDNIKVGKVDAGWGNVYLTAVWGYIEGEWNSLVTGYLVSLDAKKGIFGAKDKRSKDRSKDSGALNTNASVIVANVTGKRASIDLNNVSKKTVTLEYVSTHDGKITVTSNGSIDANNVQSRGGDIKLTAKDNIKVGKVDAGWGNVYLTAVWGYIEGEWNSLVTGYLVSLDAKKGIFGAKDKRSKDRSKDSGALNTNASVIVANVTGKRASIDLNNVSKKTVTLEYVSTHDGKITVTSNGSIDAKNVQSRGGDIKLTAKDNIKVGKVDAGWGNVYLTAVWGYIEGEWNSLVTGYLVSLDAKKGIFGAKDKRSKDRSKDSGALNTNASVIVANVTGKRASIDLNNVSKKTVTLEYVSTHDGKITVTSNGSIDAKNVQSRGGNIDLTAKNNIIVGNINAGWGNVDLTALFGYIEGSSWGWSLVTGNEVTLDAKKGIGGRHALKTDARSIVADVWGRHGSINIDNVSKDTVTLKYISTRDGKITIASNGSIDAKNVQSHGGNIDLTAKNNIIVGNINAGWGNVDLTALFGYIEGSSWGWSLVTGNEVTLDAKKGIGGRHALKTDARSIVADVWGRHGSINIDNVSKDTVTLKYISTRDGKITIKSNGSIDAKDVQSRGGNIDLTAKNNIEVGKIDAGRGNVYLTAVWGYIEGEWNSLVTGYLVSLDAKKGIFGAKDKRSKDRSKDSGAFNTNASVIVANVTGKRASIDLNNVSDRTVTLKDISTRDGKITVASNGSIDAKDVQSRGGDIKLTAKKDIIVGNINAGWGNVDLTALFGYIEGSWNSFISGYLVSLNAKKGIGSGRHAIKTNARVIVANVWGRHGSININDVSKKTVTLKSVTTNHGSITIKSKGTLDAKYVDSHNGDIDLTSKTGDINAGIIDAGRGYVILTSEIGSIFRLWFNSLVTGYLVNLEAATGIGTDSKALNTKADTLEANVSGNGSINIKDRGDVDIENATTTNGSINIKANGITALKVVSKDDALGNNITLTASSGDLHVGTVTAGSNNGQVTLNATKGSILDDDSSVTANNITLNAGTDIGSSTTDLTTNSNYLNVNAGGNVYLDSTVNEIQTLTAGGLADILSNDGVLLDTITTGGDFTLEALTGDITLNGTTQSTGGAVDLLSDNGNITANPGSIVIANGNSYFSTPNGTMGLANNLTNIAINVDINGDLILNIGKNVDLQSGYLTGTVNGTAKIPLIIPSSFPTPFYPSGNVWFNGIRIWPLQSTFTLSQDAIGSLGSFVFPTSEQLATVQVTTFNSGASDQTGGLFLYHPLTDIDSGAFDQEFQLDEGAYDFIDGEILKKGGH